MTKNFYIFNLYFILYAIVNGLVRVESFLNNLLNEYFFVGTDCNLILNNN